MTQVALKHKSPKVSQSTNLFDEELVSAIRNGKIVSIKWKHLTADERRAAHVAMFHQGGW